MALSMDKKIKIIVASAILSSVIVLLVGLYVASAVMHKISERIAVIFGAVVSISDLTVAYILLTKPAKTDKQ